MSKLKIGCMIFEVEPGDRINLTRLVAIDYAKYEEPCDPMDYECGGFRDYAFATERKDGRMDNTYLANGCYSSAYKLPNIFVANKKNRKALVTLYGEKAVPELPINNQGEPLTQSEAGL